MPWQALSYLLQKKHVEWASVSAAAITETLTEAINETCFEGTVRPSLWWYLLFWYFCLLERLQLDVKRRISPNTRTRMLLKVWHPFKLACILRQLIKNSLAKKEKKKIVQALLSIYWMVCIVTNSLSSKEKCIAQVTILKQIHFRKVR